MKNDVVWVVVEFLVLYLLGMRYVVKDFDLSLLLMLVGYFRLILWYCWNVFGLWCVYGLEVKWVSMFILNFLVEFDICGLGSFFFLFNFKVEIVE